MIKCNIINRHGVQFQVRNWNLLFKKNELELRNFELELELRNLELELKFPTKN